LAGFAVTPEGRSNNAGTSRSETDFDKPKDP
jgi:hypothetical protein